MSVLLTWAFPELLGEAANSCQDLLTCSELGKVHRLQRVYRVWGLGFLVGNKGIQYRGVICRRD